MPRYLYNPDTGVLTKVKNNGKTHVYITRTRTFVRYDKRSVPLARFIWFLWYGRWPRPGYFIDHINNCPLDNRIDNLQEITPQQNAEKAARYDKPCACPLCSV